MTNLYTLHYGTATLAQHVRKHNSTLLHRGWNIKNVANHIKFCQSPDIFGVALKTLGLDQPVTLFLGVPSLKEY